MSNMNAKSPNNNNYIDSNNTSIINSSSSAKKRRLSPRNDASSNELDVEAANLINTNLDLYQLLANNNKDIKIIPPLDNKNPEIKYNVTPQPTEKKYVKQNVLSPSVSKIKKEKRKSRKRKDVI